MREKFLEGTEGVLDNIVINQSHAYCGWLQNGADKDELVVSKSEG
jgi:hypothetical protein